MRLEAAAKFRRSPNYLISQSPDKVILRNFEGVITSYPEPQNYEPGKADDYFNETMNITEQPAAIGITALIKDEKFNIVPEGLNRFDRRKTYETNPEHATLKDKRGKRDEMKEKI